MGGKPTWKWKHIYLSIAGLILFSPLGCATIEKTAVKVEVSSAAMESKAVEPVRLESEQVKTFEPVDLKEPEQAKEELAVHKHLLRGQKLLIQGDYEGSLREYKTALSLSGNGPPGDEALFGMGLIYAHPRNPKRDLAMSLSCLQRVMKGYSQSPWAEQAKIWAELVEENETLKQVIEKSKQIDIEIEGKKKEKAK